MKKVLILNYEFPPLGGGAANATHYLLKEFANYSDLQIDLVTSSVDKFKIEKFSDNITIHYLDINKKGNFHYQSIKDLLRYSFKSYFYCQKLKKQKKFDLVHTFFGIPCGYIAMKLKIPYIVSLRGSDVPFYNNRFYYLDKFIFKRLSQKIWKKAKKVIANSEKLKQLALNSLPGQTIEIIPNGIDVNKFKPNKNKEINCPIRLISTGRLIERKGYKYLIEAISGIKEVELVLVGDGNIKKELEVHVQKYNSKVIFLGNKNHDEIVNLLQRADIFVLPSLNEGMSNSILEAMACGLPIITTDTGGSLELIQGNGFIVKKGDSLELKSVIEKLINDYNLIVEMGNISRRLAEEMSWKKVAKKYQEIYNIETL